MKQTKRNMKMSRRNKKRTFRKTRQRRIKGGNDSLIDIIQQMPANKDTLTKEEKEEIKKIYDKIDAILKLTKKQVEGTKPIEKWQMDLMTEKDTYGKTLLHYACEFGLDDVVFTILYCDKEGIHVKINAQDKNGWTPLHYACANGHTEAAIELFSSLTKLKSGLKDKLDYKLQNKQGNTPLHLAAFKGHAETIISILKLFEDSSEPVAAPVPETTEASAPEETSTASAPEGPSTASAPKKKLSPLGIEYLNTKNMFLQTPLHYACRSNRDGVIDVLLTYEGLEINAKDDANKTPLHYAADKDYANIAQKLMDNGANVEFMDKNGRTPIQLACEKHKIGVVERLKPEHNYVCPKQTTTAKIRKTLKSMREVKSRVTQNYDPKRMSPV